MESDTQSLIGFKYNYKYNYNYGALIVIVIVILGPENIGNLNINFNFILISLQWFLIAEFYRLRLPIFSGPSINYNLDYNNARRTKAFCTH